MNRIKIRVLGVVLVDYLLDVAVPAVISVLLSAFGVTSYLALAVAGIVVGAKVGLGRLQDWRLDRHARLVLAAATLALLMLIALVALGVADVVAVALAGGIVAVPVLISLLGRGRLDAFAVLVLAEIAASVALTLISADVRFVLARPAVYTAVAGVAALLSCVRGRPLMLDASRPMAAAGDPVRAEAFEAAWDHSPAFRRLQRISTAGLGAVLLAEAALRVVIVDTTGRPDVVLTALVVQLPVVVLSIGFVLALRFWVVPRARCLVDAFMPASQDDQLEPSRTPSTSGTPAEPCACGSTNAPGRTVGRSSR